MAKKYILKYHVNVEGLSREDAEKSLDTASDSIKRPEVDKFFGGNDNVMIIWLPSDRNDLEILQIEVD